MIISVIKETDNLINATKNQKLDWINMDYLKSFLRESEKSLNDFQLLHQYLVHLQKDLFIFDCTKTYLALNDGVLYAVAKSKSSFTHRIDKISLFDETIEWKRLSIPSHLLLRLRNAIEIMALPTSFDMCEGFTSAISSEISV